ncbi:carbon-phosphorus lyase complex subunit PhnI [Mesorhizobium tianshanense]|uniref:Alpha-D-ribose 1-methylphosphonate 5-triphosphate synthase subunit PhnI n=1 Tax=Mesorhizobium tianshanense TaxID=39844 RepID=A0A562NLV4_9HYPH|nr:carbon-phosphorus lyase complex subunit PhnI [Mesorhizobium tianshanense]TWI33185.1 alpha-D-ribose 1-methylphosphonate 5-triphosphate synthase subunit PhnI [Mesorhizobium tianshanense]GLS34942.1 carbon-phosphorus lyase complex subunit PhnI [Mesorhizobium tianshanense]
MAYVAVKGGERAIINSHRLIAEERRGNPDLAELTISQISEQLGLSVDRVMNEGSIYDRDLAALALKQAQGDAVEAIFLLRAYRTTLPRIAVSKPIDTTRMTVRRRISATFKDIPGGQVLGPTYDYTHRLLDFALAAECGIGKPEAELADEPLDSVIPRVIDLFDGEGLIEADISENDEEVFDLTREPMSLPAGRDQRLQNLARGDEGFVLGLAYSTARGYGGAHPFVGELRLGEVIIEIVPEDLGFPIEIAEVTITECQMINQFRGTAEQPPQFTRGYGLTFGHCERKAMSMALVDRALRARELGEDVRYPAQDEGFVLPHTDSVEANGFVTHFKLPHYVDFQAELQLVRQLREQREADQAKEAAE